MVFAISYREILPNFKWTVLSMVEKLTATAALHVVNQKMGLFKYIMSAVFRNRYIRMECFQRRHQNKTTE
jgi:hypothetical protein